LNALPVHVDRVAEVGGLDHLEAVLGAELVGEVDRERGELRLLQVPDVVALVVIEARRDRRALRRHAAAGITGFDLARRAASVAARGIAVVAGFARADRAVTADGGHGNRTELDGTDVAAWAVGAREEALVGGFARVSAAARHGRVGRVDGRA